MVAALVAAVASLIVGEYGVAGWVTLMVGIVTGLVVGEITASIARSTSWGLAVAAGVLAALGVLGWEAAVAPAIALVVTVFSVRTYRAAAPNAREAVEGEEASERLGDD